MNNNNDKNKIVQNRTRITNNDDKKLLDKNSNLKDKIERKSIIK